jgi:mono/diheme cytochrome c family protein
MKRLNWISGVLGVAALCLSASAVAQAGKYDWGKREYLSHCSACHGETGKGDGPYRDFINKSPSDLTTLAKRNGGAFPIDRVYATIDGREVIKWHGTRDMPIWGADFVASATNQASVFYYDPEVLARSRILILVDDLYRIQEK